MKKRKLKWFLLLISILFIKNNSIAGTIYDIGKINVISSPIKIYIKNISGTQLKSGDLADTLNNLVPSVRIIRRSGIANDIVLRGQKKDNINFLIDGGKIYGACPNRMDPPVAHVITENIKSLKIIEGPYDVEDFGTLSGAIKVITEKPSRKSRFSIDLNAGSWNYRRTSIFGSGGTDAIRLLVGGTFEKSDQYKDGDGNTLAKQLYLATEGSPFAKMQYQKKDEGRFSFIKKSLLTKLYLIPSIDQEFSISYTVNRNENILYPSTPMDANADNSNLINIKYSIKNLGILSKKLKFLYYYSYVHHLMTNNFRKASLGPAGIIAHKVNSMIYGGKIINSFDLGTTNIEFGIDLSKRVWNSDYFKHYNTALATHLNKGLPRVKTKNTGFFARLKKRFSKLSIESGVRYDYTKISDIYNDPSKTYKDLSAYIFSSYKITSKIKVFAGAGKSIRVPDGKELYFRLKDLTGKSKGKLVGNPHLKEVENYETDIGVEGKTENSILKITLFYSKLRHDILYNAYDKQYQNVNARVFGYSVSATHFFNDNIYVNGGIAYTRGIKDHPMHNETDKDLPDITPLKFNIALNCDYERISGMIELVGSKRWTRFDKDNGEQEIPGWAIMNTKLSGKIYKNMRLNFGINNVFNKTYAISNTYKDLTLISGSTGKVMLLNEPGRYIYANLSIVF